jgi:recombination protein RecA
MERRLEQLREALQRVTGPPMREAHLPTGWAGVDAFLGGGLPRGRLVEISGAWSSGKTALALSTGARATAGGYLVAYVDARRELYPPSAAAIGVALDRLLVVRPPAQPGAIARAGEIITRSRAFPLVLLDLPDDERLGEPSAGRLRAAAHAAGAAVVVLAGSGGAVASPAVRLEVAPRGEDGRRHLTVTLRKGGTAAPGSSVAVVPGARAGALFSTPRQAALVAFPGLDPIFLRRKQP